MKKILFLGILLFEILIFNSCENIPEPEPKFQIGEIVKSKISNSKGQIVYINRLSCSDCVRTYDVRFANSSLKTNTHLISDDDLIDNLPIVRIDYIREFELEKMD